MRCWDIRGFTSSSRFGGVVPVEATIVCVNNTSEGTQLGCTVVDTEILVYRNIEYSKTLKLIQRKAEDLGRKKSL
jgi:hypothetical protein